MSALRAMHEARGVAHAFPTGNPRIKAALEGARRLQREVRSGHQQAALAVSAAHLKLLLAVVVGRPY